MVMESFGNMLSCFITLCFLTFSTVAKAKPSSGFTLDLIHRDSPLSPFYNPSNSYFDNLHNSFSRAISRFSAPHASFQSPLTSVPGELEYLMKISVGTPPADLLAIADTGSDLTWTQCSPCCECFDQGSPLFNPQNSSTYKNYPYHSDVCQSLKGTSCSSKKLCQYLVFYGDGSFSNGNIASESFTFDSTSGKPVIFKNITFGCGRSNGGNLVKPTTGVVGLGKGEGSIIRQLSDTIDGKFSYCLVPSQSNVSSKINFGSNAVVSGSGVVSTPIITKEPDTYYFVNLESVTVGDVNVKFITNYKNNASTSGDGDGNIAIDSGTSITFLPSDFYRKMEDEVKRVVSAPIIDDPYGFFSLCYKKVKSLKVPNITFQFTGGDWILGQENTMVEVKDGVTCLAFKAANISIGLFGNFQQVNYLVGFDLKTNTVSFKPTDCSKYS